jgi:hypothetical protein
MKASKKNRNKAMPHTARVPTAKKPIVVNLSISPWQVLVHRVKKGFGWMKTKLMAAIERVKALRARLWASLPSKRQVVARTRKAGQYAQRVLRSAMHVALHNWAVSRLFKLLQRGSLKVRALFLGACLLTAAFARGFATKATTPALA